MGCAHSYTFAWSGDGRQIVALIAEERLMPETKSALRELLGPDANTSDAETCMFADNPAANATIAHFGKVV
jgi:hypothetical protein